jgi:hypothetical protein
MHLQPCDANFAILKKKLQFCDFEESFLSSKTFFSLNFSDFDVFSTNFCDFGVFFNPIAFSPPAIAPARRFEYHNLMKINDFAEKNAILELFIS